jgi:hypothetical protein
MCSDSTRSSEKPNDKICQTISERRRQIKQITFKTQETLIENNVTKETLQHAVSVQQIHILYFFVNKKVNLFQIKLKMMQTKRNESFFFEISHVLFSSSVYIGSMAESY